jgi:hypothetical protein
MLAVGMRVFKNKRFSRFSEKHAISDEALITITEYLEAGQSDAGLGSGVYKQRVARSGEGKSGSYRCIVFFRSGLLTFFVNAFLKADLDNISQKELQDYKKLAKMYLAMTKEQLKAAKKSGTLIEIGGEHDDEV